MQKKTLQPELHRRIQTLQELVERAAAPISGHLRIQTAGRVRDIFLGSTAAPSARPPVVDWESAPLAGVFFDSREGEEFELELGERILEGQVLERNLLLLEQGKLVELITERERCTGTGEARWSAEARAPVLVPRPGDRRPRTVELDEAQQAIVDLPRNRSALVLGEAGAGKTTVAVHRIKRLLEENPRWRAGVIVPTAPLRRRIESMLDRLGVRGVQVFDFDRWAMNEARRAFRDLPPRDSRDAPAGVVRIKRDPALRVAMERLVQTWPSNKRRIVRDDLADLFGDRAMLELMAAHADPLVPIPQIQEVLDHTRVQFSVSAEDEWGAAGADADRLAAVDGAGLDEGTEFADAGTLDPEDPPVLFALDRMRAERRGQRPTDPKRFDLLFVDEAQELAPFELELLGRAYRRSLIVAGDAGQQVDPSAGFRGWETTLQNLGVSDAARAELEIGYRCPPPIADFANAIAAGGVGAASPEVRLVGHSHESHLLSWLVDELRALRRQDPAITIGVVVRDAQRFSRLLSRAISVVDAEELRPGNVHVVSVLAAKGLEFDTVIVADADQRSFPDSPASRRALYVAMTRATHQLALTWSGTASPLLRP